MSTLGAVKERQVDEEMCDFDPYVTLRDASHSTNCPRVRTGLFNFSSDSLLHLFFIHFHHPRVLQILPANMSGAAASAGASKFTAFMNHPAGKQLADSTSIWVRLRVSTRTQDCLLLGTSDEVVLGGRWYQRLDSASREIERVSEHWCVS